MQKEAELAQTSAPAGWSGKMSPELLAPTKEPISASCSKKQQKWLANKPPLFLSLKTDGLLPDALPIWEDNGALRGEYLMHSFGVCPKDENASHLSQILEASPHPKYSLSAKACLGILRRAERRGKELPPLKLALEIQAQTGASPSMIKLPATAAEGLPDTAMVSEMGLELELQATPVLTLPLGITTPFSLPVESHPQDSRVKIAEGGVVQTLSGKMGTGGNVPLLLQSAPFSYGCGQDVQEEEKDL